MADAMTKVYELLNKYGMHARPAMKFVGVTSRFQCSVSVTKDGKEVDGKSIMGIMTLAAEKGSMLTVKAEGSDAAELLAELQKLFESRFGEE